MVLQYFFKRNPELSRHIELNYTNIALLFQETTHEYRKLTNYWTKCCYLSPPFSLLTAACASFAFLSGTVFSVLGHRYSEKLNVTSDHLRGAWFFSKLSLAKYHFLQKKPVFKVTSIYFISCLQLSTEM